jgi:plasmid stability protein
MDWRWLTVGQLVVRNIEDPVKEKLRRRAKQHGWSMEEEVREILRSVPEQESASLPGLGTEISNLFRQHGLEGEIPELRGFELAPSELEP